MALTVRPGTTFSPASSASNNLLSPSFTSTPGTEHITIEDDPAASPALPCLDFATTPTNVTYSQVASTALPPQPNLMHLAAAILPQRLLFDVMAGYPSNYETNRIIDQFNQQHEREMSRLRDEHQSQLQVLKAHHDAALEMRNNTHDAALPDLRTRVTGFDAQLQDLCAENQRLRRHSLAPAMPDMSLVMGLLGDVFGRQDVPASRIHSTLSSLIPRDRFTLLPANHELFLPSVPLVVSLATMLGIAPVDCKELQRSFRAECVARFHHLPSFAAVVSDSTVPPAS